MQPLLVIMGVTGCGKSTIGALLASQLRVPFEDADDLHSEANIRKMAAGHPLTDEDRLPWLRVVGEHLKNAESTGLVIACSALKRSYRQLLRDAQPRTRFVYLEGSRALLAERLRRRHGHFMPDDMLDSQLDTLEALEADEPGVTVSIDANPAQIVADIRSKLAAL